MFETQRANGIDVGYVGVYCSCHSFVNLQISIRE